MFSGCLSLIARSMLMVNSLCTVSFVCFFRRWFFFVYLIWLFSGYLFDWCTNALMSVLSTLYTCTHTRTRLCIHRLLQKRCKLIFSYNQKHKILFMCWRAVSMRDATPTRVNFHLNFCWWFTLRRSKRNDLICLYFFFFHFISLFILSSACTLSFSLYISCVHSFSPLSFCSPFSALSFMFYTFRSYVLFIRSFCSVRLLVHFI